MSEIGISLALPFSSSLTISVTSSLVQGDMKKLLHDLFLGSKKVENLSPGSFWPFGRVEEYTFVFRFRAIEEKKILNYFAITLLS